MEPQTYIFQEVESTNDEAKRLAQAGEPAGTVVIAKAQTKGRGQKGRQWYSEPGTGLYFSMILRPKEFPEDLSKKYVRKTAEIITTIIRNKYNLDLKTEWPNDLILDGRKVGGILLESVSQKDKVFFLVLGIGLNINQTSFPEELKHSAISFYQAAKKEFDIEAIAEELKEVLINEFC